MPIFVKASRRAKAHTRRPRSSIKAVKKYYDKKRMSGDMEFRARHFFGRPDVAAKTYRRGRPAEKAFNKALKIMKAKFDLGKKLLPSSNRTASNRRRDYFG